MSLHVRAPARPLILALIAAMAITMLPAAAARPVLALSTDLFFSEVIEGSSNNKALEIFNDTGSAVDLAAGGYSVQMYFNGSAAAGLTINLTGAVAQADVYVVAHSSANDTILAQADLTNGSGWFNGDDAIVLRKGTTILDVVGQIGSDPGTEWGAGLTSTADNTLRRKAAIVTGDPDGTNAFDPSIEWDGFATDTFAGLGAHPGLPPEPGPVVVASSPVDGAVDVASDAPLSVTFSEPVTLDVGAIDLECTGADMTVGFGSGPATSFELTYSPALPVSSTCALTITAVAVHDVDTNDPFDTMAADVVVGFSTAAPGDPCAAPFTSIPAIQGVDDTADVLGAVTTEGVVVSDDEGPSPTLRGFYLQDPIGDGDQATSDGIFVFNGNNDNVANGDNVRVTGTASEFQGQTQISASSIVSCDTSDTAAPTDISFPVASPTSLEAYEGMLVRVPEVMTVTEHFQLGRFGQVLLSSEGRLDNPTAVVAPGAPAVDLQAQNNLRKIILDDSSQVQNPDPIRFGRGGQPLSASNTLRGGDTVTNLVGVMTYTWAGNAASGNAYRIRPLNALGGGDVDFQPANPRPDATVALAGDVRVAGLNLLNYFVTFDGIPDAVDNCVFGVGGAPADCRGADTQAEFDRQWPKTVAAIVGLDADVIGVNEIENNGYGPDSALAHLVDRLNEATVPGTYAYIDVDAGTGQLNAAGTDAIKVGLIYRPAAVTPVGTTAALNTEAFVNGGDGAPRSRPSIAQAFETPDGARFIVDVNHLKSKGSACDDPDAGDGQGNCNIVRTNAATELAAWLAADPTGTGDDDILIVGDLNSYALEDPVTALTDAGFINLVDTFVDDPYSYVFDGQWGYLDYALGTASVVSQIAGVVEWHINSDEPSVLDYNLDFKTVGQQLSLYAPDRFRVSDHDPILVGLDLDSDAPTVDAGGPYKVVEGGSVSLSATGDDPTGDALTYAWDLDDNGSFETPGQTVTFSAAGLQAPGSRTVAVQVTDASGQTATDEATIEIVWSFKWRLPVQTPPKVNVWLAGLPFLAPFSLAGNQGLAVLDGPVKFQQEHCQTGAPIGSAQPISTIGPALGYEPRTDSYWFIWRTTRSLAGKCGSLIVTLDDGNVHEANFRFLR